MTTVSITRCIENQHESLDDQNLGSENQNAGPSFRSVWHSKGKPCIDDFEATRRLLELRADSNFMKKFEDKKSCKLSLWGEIASDLRQRGYDVNAEKCRQKFYNQQKIYIEFVRHCHTTGKEKKTPPEFYDLLHIILGQKDKVTLTNVVDSLAYDKDKENVNVVVVNDLNNVTEGGSSSESNKTADKNSKSLKITKQDILREIRQQSHSQIDNFNKMYELLKEQNTQRKELIDVFKTLVDTGKDKRKQKRKRESSSDSE